MEYNTNGKGVMALMKHILIIYSPNWKCMVLWKIVFEIGNGLCARSKNAAWKIQCQSKLVLYINWKRQEQCY